MPQVVLKKWGFITFMTEAALSKKSVVTSYCVHQAFILNSLFASF